MNDIVMKIKRSEYLEMQRIQTALEQENKALKKELETLKNQKITAEKAVVEKKGAK